MSNFYEKLYSRQTLDENQMDMYCQNINHNIKKKPKDLCDQKVLNYEILNAIDSLKDNKSPENDGIIGEFYKSFKDALDPFLACVLEESITKGKLPPSMQQGLIKLIPKPNKDKMNIENWRPITLLNNDAKIFASIFAQRLKRDWEKLLMWVYGR